MRNVLIVYTLSFGNTKRMAEAVTDGARSFESTEVFCKEASEATAADVCVADAIVYTIPSSHHAFVHVIQGSGEFGAERSRLETLDAALLEPGSKTVTIQANELGLHYLLGAGEPLNESIVSQGPFVINTAEEI
jgi:redox-sensitive bicupin YhaK (pirin superfamily)